MVGGALVAQLVAAKLDVECYFTQRVRSPDVDGGAPRYRLPNVFRRLANGKTVAVVDDAINAGSAVLGSLAELATAGACVSVVGTFVALGAATDVFPTGGKIRLESILSIPSGFWPASECLLCSAGVPLDDGA
jgi:orotate phosphoribosyltransferase